MPTFILAGVQRSLAQRVTHALDTNKDRLDGWSAIVVASQRSDRSILNLNQVDDLRMHAATDGGAHIFALSDDRDRDLVANALSPYFRFRWFDVGPVRQVGGGNIEPLLATLEQAVNQESFWVKNVKPDNCASPLILPSIFKPTRGLDQLWRLAVTSIDVENMKAAQRLAERFSREHRQKVSDSNGTPWVDTGRWIWDDDGPRHGDPEFPDGWKYSYQLPDGFHFDVKSEGKRNSSFRDANGLQHSLKKGYLNITAHGLVRGHSGAATGR